MRGFDKEGFLKGLGKKGEADKAESGEPETEEMDAEEEKTPAMRPGKQLLKAIEAKDPEAIEEAVKACHEDYEE